MFLRYFVELGHPAVEVTEALLAEPNEWLTDLVQNSVGVGTRLSADVGLKLGRHRVQRRVDVDLGEPAELAGATLVPITWVDHSHAGLFPRLDADLEIARLGERRSLLAINVRYEPPLGVIGAAVDRALMHRVAEATVKDFLDRVAKRIHQQLALRTASLRPDATYPTTTRARRITS